MKRPELLSPAGSFDKMRAAILYGADAVYLAGDDFGMRAAAANFTLDELAEAVSYAHSRGVRINLTLNTTPHSDEYPKLTDYIREIAPLGINAVIAVDLGVISLVKKYMPDTELHIDPGVDCQRGGGDRMVQTRREACRPCARAESRRDKVYPCEHSARA